LPDGLENRLAGVLQRKGKLMGKLYTWLVVAFAGGALVAGCGSSATTTSTQTAPAAATSTPAGAASTPTAAASTPAGGTTAPSSGATGKAAEPKPPALLSAAACKQAINAQSAISGSAKAKLEAVCQKAASGDTAALHKAAQEACVELVNASNVPVGAPRERALAICHTK
jgi:hypothetical protein